MWYVIYIYIYDISRLRVNIAHLLTQTKSRRHTQIITRTHTGYRPEIHLLQYLMPPGGQDSPSLSSVVETEF
jgi:hypothetical protein